MLLTQLNVAAVVPRFIVQLAHLSVTRKLYFFPQVLLQAVARRKEKVIKICSGKQLARPAENNTGLTEKATYVLIVKVKVRPT